MKVSVIVPIYKVEAYLGRALDSLLNQTHSNWEAILVDDGSPDNSGAIAEEYAARDPRFKVIHKENGGLSDARNAGMKEVTGEGVLYLDSDDFFHPQLIELTARAMERDNSDIVCFTYNRLYRNINGYRHKLHMGDSQPRFRHYKGNRYVSTDNIWDYVTERSKPWKIGFRWAVKHCQVWRCMYRTSIIRDLEFIRGINFEDFPWWGQVLKRVNHATILNLPLYYYYPNPSSYLATATLLHMIESLEQAIAAAEVIFADGPEYKNEVWQREFVAQFKRHRERYRRRLEKRK